MKTFKEFLNESKKSDAHELAVAKYINDVLGPASGGRIKGHRPPVGTSFADVVIIYKPKNETAWRSDWVEVKMNHTDNLGNPRVFFQDGKWQTTYDTILAKEAVKLLNSSEQAKKFVTELAATCNIPIKKIYLSTTKGGLKLENAVQLDQMRAFCNKWETKRYICKDENYNVSEIVKKHYAEGGKEEDANLIQVGEDLYRLSNNNAIGFEHFKNIPMFKGTGLFGVRVSTRSEFYEIQIELKVKKGGSPSDYTLWTKNGNIPSGSKKLPFEL